MADTIDSATMPASGLERLRAGIGRPPSGMAATLGFRVTEAEPGRVTLLAEPSPAFRNVSGNVHGGWAATLLDSAMGCAALSTLGPGQGCVTIELKASYHRPITPHGGPVTVTGVVLSAGRRAVFAEARVTDAGGRLLASGTSTLMVQP